jgi:membrane-associated protease RseP (regulator of RpoE activity)
LGFRTIREQEELMAKYLVTYGVVGLLLLTASSRQQAIAQAPREPTIDDRYRDVDGHSPDTSFPRLNPPQPNSTHDLPAPAKNSSTPFLGVTFAGNERAAVVRRVAAGSPAEQAGLQPNDLIETLQGRRVRTSDDVLDIIGRMRPGDVLEIEFSRRMNIRTQAPLASAPPPGPHRVGYPPELPPSTFAAPEDPIMQSNRNSRYQDRNDSANGQRRDDDQKSNQPEENRRFLDRLLRRR